MAEQENNEVDEEKRARGGKRTFESKVAEVSTSKSKKRAKRALVAETPVWSINAGGESDFLDYTVKRGGKHHRQGERLVRVPMAICIQQAGS
jgi:hypothetical protein